MAPVVASEEKKKVKRSKETRGPKKKLSSLFYTLFFLPAQGQNIKKHSHTTLRHLSLNTLRCKKQKAKTKNKTHKTERRRKKQRFAFIRISLWRPGFSRAASPRRP